MWRDWNRGDGCETGDAEGAGKPSTLEWLANCLEDGDVGATVLFCNGLEGRVLWECVERKSTGFLVCYHFNRGRRQSLRLRVDAIRLFHRPAKT